MSSPSPRPIAHEVRAEARRQSRSVAAGLFPVVASVLALLAVVVVVVLDYQFGQAPHRVIKLLLGTAVGALILFQPRVGLFLIPIVTPFLPWIPAIPVPGLNALNALLGSVFVTWAVARAARQQPYLRAGKLTWPIVVLVGIAALSVVRGAAFPAGYDFVASEAGIELFRLLTTVAAYFIALAMARGERDRKVLAWSIVIGLLAEGVVTSIYGRTGRGSRAVGSIGQANELGAFLALYTPFALALIPAVRGWFGRMVLVGAVLAGTWASILSLSRGSLVALGVAFLYVGLRTSKTMVVLLMLVGLSSPLWAPDYLKDRILETRVEDERGEDAGLDNASQVRLDTWRAIVDIVTDHPLEGVGFSGLRYVLPDVGSEMGVEVKDSSHNSYLRSLAEMGVFGLILFVFVLWRCWKLADGARTSGSEAFDRQLGVGLGAMTLSLAISCAFGDRFFNVLIVGNFWVACALADDLLLERKAAVAVPDQPAAGPRERPGHSD